jgi:hypothetical protein
MKANEAPDKIYVQLPSRNWIGRTWNETPIKEGDNPNWKNATNIEYTRTDAFTKKALKFIKTNVDRIVNNQYGVCVGCMDREFEIYMKGE